MTHQIARVVAAALPALPANGASVLPDWAEPAVRFPRIQPWSENLRRFAIGIADNEGHFGWFGPVSGSVATIVQDEVAAAVVGSDLCSWRNFSDLRLAGRHVSGPHVRMAVSAVELAAWDLRSRVSKTAVSRLLGNPPRARVPAYATALGIDIDHPLAPDIARWIADQGFWGQKWALPGYHQQESPRVDAERLSRIRHAVGDHVRLCVDARGLWTRPYLLQMLPILAEHKVCWLEEPGRIDPAELSGFGMVFAGGEHDYDPRQQLAGIVSGGLQVWQPDPVWNGGLVQSVRMVEFAALHGIECFPHGSALPAAVQLAQIMPAAAVPAVEYHLTLEPFRQAIYQQPLVPDAGHFVLDDQAGLSSTYRFAPMPKEARDAA